MHATLNRQVPAHHQDAINRLRASRYLDAPHGLAERLVDKAAITAWALRPRELQTITLDQYTELVMHDCYPLALKHALLHQGDRRHIRTVADEINRRINRHYA